GDAERAIRYFASIRALRPADAAVGSALARLYVRVGRKSDLIDLLCDRAAQLSGPAKREHQRRIAALWLELGKIKEASATLESALEEGAPSPSSSISSSSSLGIAVSCARSSTYVATTKAAVRWVTSSVFGRPRSSLQRTRSRR